MPKPDADQDDQLIAKLFKGWLAIEIREGIEQFDTEIVPDLKSRQAPRPFLERFLLCLIRAYSPADTPEKQIRERLRKAMTPLVGYGPKHKSSKLDDTLPLQWMADQYVYEREFGERRPASIQRLAEQAAKFAEGQQDATERLRRGFSANKRKLLENASARGAKIEMIERAALHDIDERLRLFGIRFEPDN